MARPTVKSTYSLDVDTVQRLERLARRWKVSKSEAMRRAILSADEDSSEQSEALQALNALQESLRLTPARAREWEREAREERRASALRMERRSRS